MTNLALMSRRRADAEDRELLWDVLLPTAAYVLIATAAWALKHPLPMQPERLRS